MEGHSPCQGDWQNVCQIGFRNRRQMGYHNPCVLETQDLWRVECQKKDVGENVTIHS